MIYKDSIGPLRRMRKIRRARLEVIENNLKVKRYELSVWQAHKVNRENDPYMDNYIEKLMNEIGDKAIEERKQEIKRLKKEKDGLLLILKAQEDYIGGLDTPEKEVAQCRILEGLTQEETATRLFYSDRQVTRVSNRVAYKIKEII